MNGLGRPTPNISTTTYGRLKRRPDKHGTYHAADANRLPRREGYPVNTRKFHEIWIEQCDAAHEIKRRYGVKAAFDYLVAEKLFNFVDAATTRPEFATELPRFVGYVRDFFTPQEMQTHLARMARERTEYAAVNDNAEGNEFDAGDELIRESPGEIAKRVRRFATIKKLLTTLELGTS